MQANEISLIHAMRRFNRFYTNLLGLLDRHLLDSDFSLAEVRVLYEIGHIENCTAKDLISSLRIDAGYLSRIIKRLQKEDLLTRVQSANDGRLHHLNLTEQGKNTLTRLDTLSNGQIQQLIRNLPQPERENIAESMKTIEKVLSGKRLPPSREFNIRCDLKPGDVGELIGLHGRLYAVECGYNHEFEGYVCQTIYKLFQNYSPNKDKFWFIDVNDQMMGALAVVEHAQTLAQLRWFILHPSIRQRGLGKKLLTEALIYCKERGYHTVFLQTTSDQETAITMYTKAGFRKVREERVSIWGKDLVEQTFELNLT